MSLNVERLGLRFPLVGEAWCPLVGAICPAREAARGHVPTLQLKAAGLESGAVPAERPEMGASGGSPGSASFVLGRCRHAATRGDPRGGGEPSDPLPE